MTFFTLCHDCRVDSQLQINVVLTPSDSPAPKQVSRMTLRLRHALVLLLMLLFLEGGEGWWNRRRLRLVRQRPSPTNTNKCQVLRDLLKKTRLSQRDISMILNADDDPIMTKYKQNSVDQRDSMAAGETLH
ncbi:uncharacterized protein [Haliotis cracherodii]|uniref:uncharacterized protein n=1 Tax=Haliotis cracherodii TaxID=6455 RepID=UPI0039E84355